MTELSDRVLVALYYEQIIVGRTYTPLEYIDNNYSLPSGLGLEMEANDLLDNNLVTLELNDAGDGGLVLTDQGRKAAESLIADGVQARLLTSFSDGTTFSDGTRFATDVPPLAEPGRVNEDVQAPVIHSQSWTGVQISKNQREALIDNISGALRALDRVPMENAKKAQARCFLKAALDLAEAPEPPLDVIQFLLKYFDRTVGVSGLLVGLASFLVNQ